MASSSPSGSPGTHGADLDRRHDPEGLSDRFAKATCVATKLVADVFFKKRYGARAVVLETIATVPGMVAATFNQLAMIRDTVMGRTHDGALARTFYEESDNELMHLKTFIEVTRPSLFEKALVFGGQAAFFCAYSLLYLASPRTAHRLVGFIEEEAVNSYTNYLEGIDSGRIENIPAPPLAIRYWKLPADARLREVVTAVRNDEAGHRDLNHGIASRLTR